jgi:hypothetical protein
VEVPFAGHRKAAVLPIKKTIFQEEIAMSARTLQPTRRHAIFGGITAIGAGAAILGKAPLAFADSRLPVSSIEAVFGAPGEQEEGGVLHFDFARTDLAPVSLFGIALDSGIGFDTEINFQPVGNRAVVKWELCLLETEINPVIDGLFQTGLLPRQSAVNAIHNHFLQATPEVKFMHGTAFGDPVQIAQAWYQVLKANTGQPFETMPPGRRTCPTSRSPKIIGGTSSVSGIILNVEVPGAIGRRSWVWYSPQPSKSNRCLVFKASGTGKQQSIANIPPRRRGGCRLPYRTGIPVRDHGDP